VRADHAAVWVDTSTADVGPVTAMRLSLAQIAAGQPVMMIEVGEIIPSDGEPYDGLEESAVLLMPLPALIGLRQLITNAIESAK